MDRVEKSPRVAGAELVTDVPRGRGAADRPRETEGGASGRTKRRCVTAIALGLWFGFATLCCGELVVRGASRFGILVFDTEMWRYAREVKRPSTNHDVVLEHRPNVEATLMGVRMRTDAHGFRRAAPELEAARTGNERIIALVGDSCALGWGVPEGATLGEQLERTLDASQPGRNRVVVINAGVGNSNTAMEYARYVEHVRPLHPVWVILGFFINDAEPDPSATSSPLLEHSVLLATLATRIPSLLLPSRRDYRSYYGNLYAPESAGLAKFRRALRAFGASLREDGALGTVLLIPEMHEPRDFGPFANVYRQVAVLAAESGFDVIDPSAEFAPGPSQTYWVTKADSHPNAEAHAILAAALARSETARRLTQPVS